MTEKKKAPARKKGKKKEGAFVARGKRKKSIARAAIVPGTGRVRINKLLVSAHSNKYVREIILEPIRYAGPEVNSVDIAVIVNGGGMMGQAQAARTAIAKALVGYFKNEALKAKFDEIDRSLLVEDARRVETKKYKGPKARARFQKSYR